MKFNLKNVFMTVCILCIKTAKRGKLLNDIALEAISAGFIQVVQQGKLCF